MVDDAKAPPTGGAYVSTLDTDLSFLLARANAFSMVAANGALAPFGLKVRSFAVLFVLSADARPSQRELSELLRLDPSQVVALVDELEARGLVRREPDPTDRRAKVIHLTDGGRRLFERAQPAALDAERALHSALSATERSLLVDLLGRIAFPDGIPQGAGGPK